MSNRRAAAGAALVVVLAGATGCGGSTATADDGSRPDGRLVLVSGRDDHGELALPQVPLYETAAAEHVVGRADDGTLAQVVSTDGQMLEVAPVDGGGAPGGWIDDFYLRGTLHLVGPAPTCRGRLGGELQEAGLQVVVRSVRGGQVLVESVADPTTRGWVGRGSVQELPPQGGSCDGGPTGGGHTH